MNIGADEKKQVARLLNFLLSGEKVAQRCSKKQSQLTTNVHMKRFFVRQARQETFHAATFKSAILLLAPKGVQTPSMTAMRQYETLLNDAISNQNLSSSILGLQVILEGMGDIVLSHISNGIEQRGIGYRKIRQAILAQEDTHHQFGLDYFRNNGRLDSSHEQQDDYLSLIDEMLFSLQGLFDFFDEDTNTYITEFNQSLPAEINIHKHLMKTEPGYDLGHHPDT